MLSPLEPHCYETVRSLFQGEHLAYIIQAVIAGNSPGTIWVDDPAQPAAALMWDRAHCVYLVGAAGRPAFLQALSQFVARRLAPEAAARRIGIFKVYYSDQEWEGQIPQIFRNISLERMERVFYTLGQGRTSDWESRVPAGFQMRQIDRGLLENRRLKNVQDLRGEIESCWPSVDRFLEYGFGFCLLGGDEIAGWCTAEYVCGRECGIGIETVQDYMRRGFATLTASAFVETCLSRGITPHWDSWKANLPSVAVAEKVGFEEVSSYWVFLGRLD